MTFFKNLSIKYKLFFAYAAVSLVVFSISFALLFFQVRNSIESRIQEALSKSNQAITDLVETAATISIKNHLQDIAENNLKIITHLFQSSLKGQISITQAKNRAEKILLSQTIGKTGYIYCVDSLGTLQVHPQKRIQGKNIAVNTFIQDQTKKKSGYLEYHWKNPGETTERAKALYMVYFEPWDWIVSVSSYRAEFAQLVSIEDFKDKVLDRTFGKTGYSFIFDIQGNMVIHPELSGNFFDLRQTRGKRILQEMIDKKHGYLTYFWKNPSEALAREKFVAFDHIPDFDWIIASSSYTAEVFSPLSEMRATFLIIFALTLLFVGCVSMILSDSITQPLTAFIKRFEKGAEGDLTSKMKTVRQDEIGQLSGSFNLFMDRIKAYQNGISLEIKTRKKTEKQLQTLRNDLADIIDSMPSMLIGVDKKMQVTLWNKKTANQTGISMEKARGNFIQDMMPEITKQIPTIKTSLESKKIKHVLKHPFVSGTKETVYVDMTIYPLAGPQDRGAVIRIDDITQKLQMEEMLIQTEKMLSVGGLAAGMAHEINNPLAGVIQNSNLLLNRLTCSDIPANISAAKEAGTTMTGISHYMETRSIPKIISSVIESSRRMAEIVDNMLSFARQGSDSFSTHDPAMLVDKILEIAATDYDLKKSYDFKSIVIEKEYEPDLPLVACESSKIQQVLLNILNNGAQAMFHSSGRLKSKFILRLSREKNQPMLRMEIEDNGPGMDEAVRKRIFEPFFTTKPVGVGTGLGLSVSYFIITENHKGTMDVVSQPGKGTRFIICLPLSR